MLEEPFVAEINHNLVHLLVSSSGIIFFMLSFPCGYPYASTCFQVNRATEKNNAIQLPWKPSHSKQCERKYKCMVQECHHAIHAFLIPTENYSCNLVLQITLQDKLLTNRKSMNIFCIGVRQCWVIT